MNVIRYTLLLAVILSFFSCSKDDPDDDPEPPVPNQRPANLEEYNATTDGLKDYYTKDGYFEIGVAIEPSFVDNPAQVALMKRHFSSITAENAMKWSSVQPTEGNFTFANADKIVNFAQANGMKVRGHTLCWHQQVPDWIFRHNGVAASKELVLERLRTHITTVMTRYKGKVYAWDVVNEAIDDGGSVYRNSSWYNICGEDFIFEAFRAARAADPAAKLFYNDYNATQTIKRDKIYALLQKLVAEGLVDGMGLQGHWSMDYPGNNLITNAIDLYRSLGIDLHITEMDVSIYAGSEAQTAYTAEIAQKQAAAYSRYFSLLRNNKNFISNVTFWGLADNHTWLDNHPVSGRKNYPLLFDTALKPKSAYFEVIKF